MTPGEDGKLASVPTPDDIVPRHRRRRGSRLVGLRTVVGAQDPRTRVDPARATVRRAAARLRPRRLHRALAEGVRVSRITVLRPVDTTAPPATITLAARGGLPPRPVIGLVDNRKPHARELLELLAEELRGRHRRRRDRARPEAECGPPDGARAGLRHGRQGAPRDHRRGRLRGVLVVQSARRGTDRAARDARDGADHRAVPGDRRHLGGTPRRARLPLPRRAAPDLGTRRGRRFAPSPVSSSTPRSTS